MKQSANCARGQAFSTSIFDAISPIHVIAISPGDGSNTCRKKARIKPDEGIS